MHTRRASGGIALVLASLVAAACGGDSSPGGTAPPTTPVVAQVVVTPASRDILVGGSTTFDATPVTASGNPVTGVVVAWTSSNPAIATVNGTGMVVGVAAGEATISATAGGKAGSALVRVTAPPPVVASVEITPLVLYVEEGTQRTITATARAADGSEIAGRTVHWMSLVPTVATVSGGGMITAVRAGSGKIQAEVDGVRAAMTITVIPKASNVAHYALTSVDGAALPGAVEITTYQDDSGVTHYLKTVAISGTLSLYHLSGTYEQGVFVEVYDMPMEFGNPQWRLVGWRNVTDRGDFHYNWTDGSIQFVSTRQQNLSYSAQGNGTGLAVSQVLDGVTKRATFAYAPR